MHGADDDDRRRSRRAGRGPRACTPRRPHTRRGHRSPGDHRGDGRRRSHHVLGSPVQPRRRRVHHARVREAARVPRQLGHGAALLGELRHVAVERAVDRRRDVRHASSRSRSRHRVRRLVRNTRVDARTNRPRVALPDDDRRDSGRAGAVQPVDTLVDGLGDRPLRRAARRDALHGGREAAGAVRRHRRPRAALPARHDLVHRSVRPVDAPVAPQRVEGHRHGGRSVRALVHHALVRRALGDPRHVRHQDAAGLVGRHQLRQRTVQILPAHQRGDALVVRARAVRRHRDDRVVAVHADPRPWTRPPPDARRGARPRRLPLLHGVLVPRCSPVPLVLRTRDDRGGDRPRVHRRRRRAPIASTRFRARARDAAVPPAGLLRRATDRRREGRRTAVAVRTAVAHQLGGVRVLPRGRQRPPRARRRQDRHRAGGDRRARVLLRLQHRRPVRRLPLRDPADRPPHRRREPAAPLRS